MRSPLFEQARRLVNDFLFWQQQRLSGVPDSNIDARNNGGRALRDLRDVREDLEALPIPDEALRRQLTRAGRNLMDECERLAAWVDERTADLRPLHAAAWGGASDATEEGQRVHQRAVEAWNAAHIPVCNEWAQVWEANVRRYLEQLAQGEQGVAALPDTPLLVQGNRILPETVPPEVPNPPSEEKAVPPGNWSRPDSMKHWCRVFRVHRNTLRARLKKGEIRGKKIGRHWMIDLEDIPAPHREQCKAK